MREIEVEVKVEINNFIGIFDNVLLDEHCDWLIEFFERMQKIRGKVWKKQNLEKVSSTVKDFSTYFFQNEEDPLIINQQQGQIGHFVEAVQFCYELYVREYGAIKELGSHVLNPDIKLLKTLPGEGYHGWHSEVGDVTSSRRMLLCMLYLNDVSEGGETEFLYQQKRIEPVKGRMVICPTIFTHTHRGNPPLNTAKYMITTWMEFISFGKHTRQAWTAAELKE